MDLLALVTGLVPALVDKIKPKHEPEVEEANAKALEPPPLPEFSYRPLTTGYDGRPVIWNLENHPDHWTKVSSTGEAFDSFYHQPSAHTFHIGKEGVKEEAYVYALCKCSNQKVADLKGLRAAFGKWKLAGVRYGGAVGYPDTREESWYGHFVYR